jgi:hypothetical protein
MKKLILFCFAIILSLGWNSCGKDNSSNDNIVVYKIPVDIAARYVAMAFCNASAGINSHLENAAAFTAQGHGSFDTSFTVKKLDSAAAVKYQYQVVYTLARLTTLPPKVTFDYTANGSFSSDAIQSQDEQTGNNWQFTTLDQSQLTLNGSGTDGGQQYALLEKVFFTSDITYTLQNVMIDKLTCIAASGTGQITIRGSGPGGVAYSYSGTLTFNGNRKAELILGGSTFYINLSTGSITK